MFITNPEIEKYAEAFTSAQSDLLTRIERETYLNALHPHMLSGKTQGSLLKLLSSLKQPTNIIEFGTYTGYASLCLVEGLKKNGVLTTIEKNDEIAEKAQNNFNQSGYKKNIELIIGDATEIIKKLTKIYEFAFIDADKKNNFTYYNWCVENMPPESIVIIDNVLWKSKVIEDIKDKDTQAIHEFNIYVKNDHRTEKILLPVRDGLYITQIKK